jgi:hypothetical protein
MASKIWIQNGVRLALIFIGLTSCGVNESNSSSESTAGCSLTSNTEKTTTVSAGGCYLLTRDTSSCQASRIAQGLSGFWLKFSCRVTLLKSGGNVSVSVDNQPDYKSAYFEASNACYQSGMPSGHTANPNTISAKTIVMTVPYSPASAGSTSPMNMGIVGVSLNGVIIYNNSAAGADDIYQEVSTFDTCDGHPDGQSNYHYHTEPPAISQENSDFVGIMRDGFPIYGRYESGTTLPSGLNAQTKGHTSTTPDSPSTSVFHYHVNLQTSSSPGTSGQTAWFLTGGSYYGTKSTTCSNCP